MKWKFWQKDEPEDLPMPADLGPGPGMEPPMAAPPTGLEQLGMPQPTPGITEPPIPPAEPMPQMPSAHPAALTPPAPSEQPRGLSTEQQLQLIVSKLDTLKAQMDVVLHRLESMQQKEEQSPYQQRWRQGM